MKQLYKVKFLSILMSILGIALATSCGDSDEPSADVEFRLFTTEIKLKAEGDSQIVSVQSKSKPNVLSTSSRLWPNIGEPKLIGKNGSLYQFEVSSPANTSRQDFATMLWVVSDDGIGEINVIQPAMSATNP